MNRRTFLQAALIRGSGFALAAVGVHVLDSKAGQRPAPRPACCCGTLRDFRELPYANEEGTGTYTLILAPHRSVPRAFCFYCGGHPRGPWEEGVPRCACGSLAAWSGDPLSAIKWDADVLETYVVHDETGGLWPVYFCPACGARAPNALNSRSDR
jgi:hypothetical protein